jgi:hypothetical protein
MLGAMFTDRDQTSVALIAHNKQVTGVQKTKRTKPASKKGKLPETV